MKLSRDGPTVRYDSVLLRETLRAREIRGATPNAPALVALCSFCQNYRFPVASKMWKEIEHLFNEADLSPEFTFTHGICDTCFARVMNA